jgi:hypothetical protein
MKTTKYMHNFFPTGRGLAIIWNDELTLFYTIGDSFNVWSTSHEAPNDDLGLRLFMDMANTMPRISTHGVSQMGTLAEVIDDMPDPVLGAIYEAVVGYNPFTDNPDQPEENRKLVYEYLDMDETLQEVFNYGKDK